MIVEWKKYEFSDCLVENNVGRSNQINASEIHETGKFPVIDQGQDYIAGYSDEEDKLVKDGLPYVIFGDHTRCFKFVDFPFIVGADGTKVLSPKTELFEPIFFYYQLLSFNIPSRGYNRHYKLLKEKIVYRPEFPEQRKIAYVLRTIQKSIEQQDKLIQTTTELKKALMQKLFTEGTKGEKQKLTEIGLVPESWEVVRVEDMYGLTSKPRGLKVEFPAPFIPMEMVPINERIITNYELRNSVSSGTYVENGDLLLAKITPSFENGKQGFVDIDKPYSFATTEVIPFKAKEGLSDLNYLYYFLLKDDIRKQLTDKMEGSTGRQRLSKSIVEETLIPKPPIEEQQEISDVFISHDKRISFYEKKKQTLNDLFKTLIYELMTGQRRVNEIDFHEKPNEYKLAEPTLSIAAEN